MDCDADDIEIRTWKWTVVFEAVNDEMNPAQVQRESDS